MKYTRQQLVLKTIDDIEMTDIESIKKLVSNIKSSSAYVSIEFKGENYNNITFYERARIINVSEDSIDVRSFYNRSTVLKTGIKLDSLISLKLVTSKNNIIIDNLGENFNFLDIG